MGLERGRDEMETIRRQIKAERYENSNILDQTGTSFSFVVVSSILVPDGAAEMTRITLIL